MPFFTNARRKEKMPYIVFDRVVVGQITLYTWGFFVGLAFAAGYLFALYRAKKKNIPPEKIFWLVLAIFFGAGLGSRATFLLQFPGEWLADVSLLWQFNQGGLMLWGGIFGAVLFGGLYVRKARLSFWEIADLIAPAIALGIGIGRIGCFLINDHLGTPTNLPWGILWPDGIARHPVALYESLVGFGLFIIFSLLWKRRIREDFGNEIQKIPPNLPLTKGGTPSFFKGGLGRIFGMPGQLFLLFLASYSFLRFLLDFLRASQGVLSDPRWWGLTSSQWISLIIFIIILTFIKIKRATITTNG
ncbi:prolipoprotein diacylglyceryl transferase [Patescibacteria group bacterium]|nr:prolipoprotein diacylglyceryl transferase [Patescibacteria group bacterium]